MFPFTEEDVGITSPALVKHGVQVMESIDAAVDLLGNTEELVETLKTLGIVHNMHSVQLESFAVRHAIMYCTISDKTILPLSQAVCGYIPY